MKRNKVKVSGRQKDKRALKRIKESNVRLYKNGLTWIVICDVFQPNVDGMSQN
jgi:hypothetical protein